MSDATDLVEVRLLAVDLADLHAAEAHHDELFREFALITGGEPSPGHEVPGRLLAIVEELNNRYAGFTTGPQTELAAAAGRGDKDANVSFFVPRDVEEAIIRFTALLTAADDYCRQGDLLTLAPPADAVAFRNWYLGEFVAQIHGSDPTPWPEYRARGLESA
ncbi:MAG: hypothetical protein ACR2GF_04730 [Acidimicrobiales bacterium]